MTTTTKHLTRLTPSDLAAELTTNTKNGLTAKEAAARLQQNGRNQLTAAKSLACSGKSAITSAISPR